MGTFRFRFAAVLAVVWLSLCCTSAAGVVPLEVEVRARALAPGEPVRVAVRSPEPLTSLDCSFLGLDIHMSPHEDRSRWSGWAIIALDQEPVTAAVEASGRTVSGGECRGTRAVVIEAREFPEERLTVQSKFVSPPAEVERRLAEERRVLRAIYRTRTDRVPLSAPFLRPVPGEQSAVFGTRRFFNDEPRSPHPGVDLRGAEGTPVLAAGPGRVVLARDLYYSGNTVILDHGGGLFTLYSHLSRLDLEEGQEVTAGERVGLVGATGRVTGPHLHWGAKIGSRPFDPTALLDPALFR